MEGLAHWLKMFFRPIELPDIGDWHHYHDSEVVARYRIIKVRDPDTRNWKSSIIYRWPNYRGQGYDASLVKHCPAKYLPELLSLTIGAYHIPRISDGLIYYMAQHDLNWTNEVNRHDNSLLSNLDEWERMQNQSQFITPSNHESSTV